MLDLSPRGAGVFESAAAIGGFYEEYFGAFEDLTFELGDAIDPGHGVSFAVAANHARPVGSPGQVRTRFGWVQVAVEVLFVWGSTYGDIDEARAAAERLAQQRERDG